MMDNDKTREQLIAENDELRRRVAALEDVDFERSRAEEELAKSKAILTAAVECLPFDFFALDPDGRCILQNAVSRRYYGNAVGKTAEQVCPDKRVLPRWLEGNRRALAGEKVEAEVALAVGGEQRNFYSVLAPIQEDDTLYGILGVNVDITDRKRTDEALRLSEGRYRALAESTRDIIFIVDRQGTLLYANQAASQCIGIPAGDIVGKRQVDLFPPEMARSQIEKIERGFATGEVIEYDDLFHFGPAEVWLRIHLIPLRDEAGQITSVMGVCHNITGWKQAEEALRERETRLLEAQEVANLGFYVVDLKTGCCTSSSVLDRIFGIPADYPRTIDGWANLLHPDNRQEMLDGFKKAVDEKKPSELEYRIIRYGDKQVRWVHGLGRLQFNANGQPVSMLGTIQDITERKLAEDALREAHDELEQRVEERTAELAKANENLDIFRKFAEDAEDGFGMSNLDGRIVYANPMLCRLFGEEKPEDVIGKHLSAYYPEEYLQRRKDEIIPSLLREGHLHVEQAVLSRHGQAIQTLQSTFLIRDQGGNPFRIAVVISDISERKKTDVALRQSQATLDAFFNASTEILNILDGELRYIKTDNLTPSYFGLDSQSIVGRSMAEIAPKLVEKHGAMIRRVIETGEFVNNLEIKGTVPSRPGDFVWWRTSWFQVPLPEGKRGLGIVGVEITELKRAEEALRASEERYELAVRGAGVGILDWDIRTDKLYYSPRWKMLFGYDENDMGESIEDLVGLLHPDERERVLKFHNDFLVGTSSMSSNEFRLRHKDGSYRWIVAHALAVRDEQDRVCRLVGSHGDITDRKRAEEALRQSHDELRAIYESIGDGLLVADRETLRIVRANAAICSMLQYSEEELLSMSIPALHPTEAFSDIVAPLRRELIGPLPGKPDVPMLRKDTLGRAIRKCPDDRSNYDRIVPFTGSPPLAAALTKCYANFLRICEQEILDEFQRK